MNINLITLALALGLATSAATAQAPATPKADPPSSADRRKYCIPYDDTTGSRVRKEECKTKAQWAREGIHVEEQQNPQN